MEWKNQKPYLLQRFKKALLYGGILFLLGTCALILYAADIFYGWIWLLGLLGLWLVFISMSWNFIYKPYQKTKQIYRQIAMGEEQLKIEDIVYPYTPEVEAVMLFFQDLINLQDLIHISKKQSQYLALQNQINPHFLYNTLEGIRGDALSKNMWELADMTEALATFFRYTISQGENLVTLGEEIRNVQNYFLIQQYRFGQRFKMILDIEAEQESKVEALGTIAESTKEKDHLLEYKIPKLTLQPIVENAIVHGLEQKVGEGIITLKVQRTQRNMIVMISDNGVGFSQETLYKLNDKLEKLSLDYVKEDQKNTGGIAMLNVHNRIRLLFGKEYGIHIFSSQGLGTDVELNLPLLKGDNPLSHPESILESAYEI